MRNTRKSPMNDETLQKIAKILSEAVGEQLYPVSASVEASTLYEVDRGSYNATDVLLRFSTVGCNSGRK